MRATEGGGSDLGVDPALAEAIAGLSASGYWALALDDQWRLVAMTDEHLALASLDQLVLGDFHFGPEAIDRLLHGATGINSVEENREVLRRVGGWMLTDIPGGREAIRTMVHPALVDVVDELEPNEALAAYWNLPTMYFGDKIGVDVLALGIDPDRVTYTQLADLDTATDKARRDAPAVPVCDIATSTP